MGYGAHFSLELVSPVSAGNGGAAGMVVAEGVNGGSNGGETFVAGDGLAYIQVGVPQFRLSKLIENGGEIISAYGFTKVAAPGGLLMQVTKEPRFSLGFHSIFTRFSA